VHRNIELAQPPRLSPGSQQFSDRFRHALMLRHARTGGITSEVIARITPVARR